MAEIITPSFENYIWAIKSLYQQGEISLENYAACLRRAKERLGLW